MHDKRDLADVTESMILRWEIILAVWVDPKCYHKGPSKTESKGVRISGGGAPGWHSR